MCGADVGDELVEVRIPGSSPRVRSRRAFDRPSDRHTGIISACAEQTATAQRWNVKEAGSSPRVRSRLEHADRSRSRTGIISACAEQTPAPPNRRVRLQDHLRVCGADHDSVFPDIGVSGSSPRVRSRQHRTLTREHAFGIISACAEQTISKQAGANKGGDHLRVCGADTSVRFCGACGAGSSPRVRSRPLGGWW